MAEDSAVNYWEVRRLSALCRNCRPGAHRHWRLSAEIRERGVRLEPEGRPHFVRAAIQAAAAVERRRDTRAGEGAAAPAAERGGLHQLLLLVHHPAGPVWDSDTHRRELHPVLGPLPLLLIVVVATRIFFLALVDRYSQLLVFR